jgi:rSAM-associated Gly-rich repeat protein
MAGNTFLRMLSVLLSGGAAALSVSLAASPADALPSVRAEASADTNQDVAQRLQVIRTAVSAAIDESAATPDADANIQKTWWGNGGWGWRGGWRNGGWGWRNGWPNGGGWRNGWGNGGWRNGGWPNGWHNAWGNW